MTNRVYNKIEAIGIAVGKPGLDDCLIMQRKQKAGVQSKVDNMIEQGGIVGGN